MAEVTWHDHRSRRHARGYRPLRDVTLNAVQLHVAGAAALVTGAVNAVAGRRDADPFLALMAISVPALNTNVTNTVALVNISEPVGAVGPECHCD